MNRPIMCLNERESARSLTRHLAAQSIPAHVVPKGPNGNPVFVVESELLHEPKILDFVRKNPAKHALLRCPSCRSTRIDYPALPDKSPTMRLLASLMTRPEKSKDAKFYCRGCHHEWTKPLTAKSPSS